jgi:hypothetical protein
MLKNICFCLELLIERNTFAEYTTYVAKTAMNHMLYPFASPPVYRHEYYACPKCGNTGVAIRGDMAICKDHTGHCMYRGYTEEFSNGHLEQ